MYFDDNELIVQKDGDGGDTAQRMGLYHSFLQMRAMLGISNETLPFSSRFDYLDAIIKLQQSPGIWRRHPDQWNDPSDFSRDQMVPNVVAMGFCEATQALKATSLAFLKRGFLFCQNKDIVSPQLLASFIRAWFWSLSSFLVILWPLLVVLDVFLLFDVILRIIVKFFDSNNVGDDLNTTLLVLQAEHSLPTPLSWLARKLYGFLPGGVVESFQWYFRPGTGANAELAEIAKPVIDKYITRL